MINEYMTLDIECFSNYFLVLFRNQEGRFREFEMYEGCPLDTKKIRGLMMNYPTITFNGMNYDMPMLSLALAGADNETLKEASDRLITTLKPWQFYKSYKISELSYDHIDLYEPAPGVMVGLKLYGGRMHVPKMQDLPYDPSLLLTREQMIEVKNYCENDHHITNQLFEAIRDRIDLRMEMSKEYRVDLRSKSDAQVAESVIKAELQRITGKKIGKQNVKESEFFYKTPEYIKFRTPQLQAVLEIVQRSPFTAKTNGQIEFTKELANTVVELGYSKYQMGIGGLHSQESERSWVADDRYMVIDRDFASYYPNIILNNNLYPQSLGKEFLDVYRTLVERRLHAKAAVKRLKDELDQYLKDHPDSTEENDAVLCSLKKELRINTVTMESLKITINGSFGKFGSVYSSLYSPDLMIQVTITGQLTLLMLIEQLELAGISVVSANTDGIVSYVPVEKYDEMLKIIKEFEELTNFETEESVYKGLYSRDVNNYIAITTKGKVKTKGTFSPPGLQKNPQNEICAEALITHLKDGATIEKTIRDCKDIRKFVTVRTVKGGGIFGDQYLGKCVRWYKKEGATMPIVYRTSGNKVPLSDGAQPVMQLPLDFPNDIDYNYYINEAKEMLMDVGIVKRPIAAKKTRAKKGI